MKKIILSLIVFSVFACNSDQSSDNNNDADDSIVEDFLENVESLEMIENSSPIDLFKEQAYEMAEEKIDLTKENIEDILNAIKHYGKCIVIVEDHTIVKIEDVEDCKQSGSWGACMPMAEGYIKKGDLEYQEDYINNIIGTPDSQERIAYFFK